MTPDNKETHCAKCGACVPVCPIFRLTGRETLTARGRIHLLAKLTNPQASRAFSDIFSKCLLCGACRKACPRGIDIPSIIITARSDTNQHKADTLTKKLVRQLLSKPSLLNPLTSVVKLTDSSATLPKESGLHLRLSGVKVTFQPPEKSFIDFSKQLIK